eukprot:365901-Chlamydomonas_euryale.AAC.10
MSSNAEASPAAAGAADELPRGSIAWLTCLAVARQRQGCSGSVVTVWRRVVGTGPAFPSFSIFSFFQLLSSCPYPLVEQQHLSRAKVCGLLLLSH